MIRLAVFTTGDSNLTTGGESWDIFDSAPGIGQGGNGALRKGGKTVGYYNSVAASYGFQAGVQKFGYALFFMSDGALSYLDKSGGWEIGVGPSIVVVD